MLNRTVILAAGGTGGHVFPAQALAEALILNGWRVVLVTDHRGNFFANEFPNEVQKVVLNLYNPRGRGWFAFIRSLWFFICSSITIVRWCWKLKVTAIVGFGGYPSATSMFVGFVLRINSVIHEQNAVLGTVNKIFYKKVKLVVFGITPKDLQYRKGSTLVLGNPIRQFVQKVVPKNYSALQLDSFLIVVVGGSQGANFVSSIACDAILDLPKGMRSKLTVMHQCRHENITEISRKYENFKINAKTKSFFNDIPSLLNAAHLIISRSGASALAEFCYFGRPSILIPLPSSVGDHQKLNASVMEHSGASVVFDENSINSALLSKKIYDILTNFKVANQMALSAKKLSKPNAALNFAMELENLR